jgi:G3E family GTPase
MRVRMKIIIVSGFLGSGKTTSIIRMGKRFKQNGQSVAVLVNDIGDVGVDGQVISNNGLESKEIPRGCICCTLKYALEANIALVQAQYDPDVLLIEPTGVAFPLRIKEQIEKMDFGQEVSMGPIVSLIDGSKFGELMEHSGDAIIKQIKNADIVVLNKKDLLNREQLAEIKASIMELNPDSQLLAMSLKDEDGTFDKFMSLLGSDIASGKINVARLSDAVNRTNNSTTASTSVSCSTACDDEFDHFNVSSYADSYEINIPIDAEAAKNLVLDVMYSVRNDILYHNPRFLGHLKMFLHTGSVGLRASVTSYLDQPEVEFVGLDSENDDGKFTVFAAVTDVARDNLSDIIENAVSARSGQLGIAA